MSPATGDERSPIEVLHVDDDEALLDIAATFLEAGDEGLHVTCESNPERALSMVVEGEFDCVVSDYDMPEMTGLDLLEAVKAERPALPFVLFTGREDAGVAVQALVAGATDYCRKQVGTEHYRVLAARIASTVEGRRERERLVAERDRLRETLAAVAEEAGRALGDADPAAAAALRDTVARLDEAVQDPEPAGGRARPDGGTQD